MRKILFIVFLFCAQGVFAQKSPKIDSVYYLIDTAKTPVNARMWELENDGHMKYYVINCACLKFNGRPSFVYDNRGIQSVTINRKQLQKIKLVNLPDLISVAKVFIESDYTMKFVFFLIEPEGEKFIIRKVKVKPTRMVQ